MSDADKPTPESPPPGKPEASSEASSGGGGGNVILLDEARTALLRKQRLHATPPQGIRDRPRSRGREVPIPVTMPPGEHSAVIVSDTPAARVHVDKKTVHPGEAPEQTHDKKVRFKTSLDPRRAKTQVTDRRSSTPAPGGVGGEVGSLWSNSTGSQPPGPITPSQPPPGVSPSGRPLLSRPRPVQRDQQSGPLFLIGVALAAAFGAVVVFLVSRPKTEPNGPSPSGTDIQLTATLPAPSAFPTGEPATTTTTPDSGAPGATTAEPVNTAVPVPSELPSAVPATPVKTGRSTSTKPSASPSAPPTASAKPTATSILPFGKEEP